MWSTNDAEDGPHRDLKCDKQMFAINYINKTTLKGKNIEELTKIGLTLLDISETGKRDLKPRKVKKAIGLLDEMIAEKMKRK